MRHHKEKKIMPFSADQMFDLVVDIEAYPSFIPWCRDIRIISQSSHSKGSIIKSEMVVAFKSLRESLISEAVLCGDKSSIEINYREKLFKYFHSKWTFHQRDDGSSLVEFETSYEFKTKIFELLAGAFFWRAAQMIVAAFEERAHKIYSSKP